MEKKSAPPELKINIGSGPIGKDSWVNLDYGILAFIAKFKPLLFPITYLAPEYKALLNSWPRTRIHNCKKKLPFRDNEVSYALTSHFLEHLKRYEAEFVLREVYRVLKPGGYFRVIVPDLEIMIQKYQSRDFSFFAKFFDGSLFIDFNEIGSDDSYTTDLFLAQIYPPHHGFKPSNPVRQLINRCARWHVWMYDFDSMQRMLTQAGFKEVEKKSHGDSKIPDISGLESHPEISLFVEAQKL